jgi:hypothetical protein
VWPWQRLASQQLTLKQQKGKNTHENKRKKKQKTKQNSMMRNWIIIEHLVE